MLPVDAGAANVIAQALRRNNPLFAFYFYVEETASGVGADNVDITIRGHRDVRLTRKLNDHETAWISFRMLEAIDPERMDASSALLVMAYGHGTITGATTKSYSWPQPWRPARGDQQLTPWRDGDGRYVIREMTVSD
jgi:hypothetical protein